MSKKFKSHASSARAASNALSSSSFGFGSPSNAFQTAPSTLSYITEFPDLSTVSDPNLVVSLRNLGKKDSTTKAKAIEELQEHVAQAKPIEPGFLDAWIALYPRASIDNSRRVRQIAHILQGSITLASGKRIAPQLPKVIGPWLSGIYDSDRAVARAAQESIAASFPTEDKRKALVKVYRDALIQYAEDAILTQTPQTLSDERSTTPEDAEAKFVRAAGTAILMLNHTIVTNVSSSSTGASSPASDLLQPILTNKKLWEKSYHPDPFLRRALYSLATTCISLLPDSLDWPVLSTCIVGKALHSSQLGSSSQLSELLISLTTVRPQIWTTDYTSKTSSLKRLLQYLRSGSQHGSASFWSNNAQLLRKIPVQVWNGGIPEAKVDLENARALLEAIKSGIIDSDEPRHNLEAAWSMYGQTVFWVVDLLLESSPKQDLLQTSVLPIIVAYISGDAQQPLWPVPSSAAPRLSASILLHILDRQLTDLFEDTWLQLSQSLISSMRLSLPESSKEFRTSQDAVIAKSHRLLRLKTTILQSDRLDASQQAAVANVFSEADEQINISAVDLLVARQGKPYGAAAVLEVFASANLGTSEALSEFFKSSALTLLDSPSAEFLVATQIKTKQPLGPIIDALIGPPKSISKSKALARILGQTNNPDLPRSSEFANLVHTSANNLNDESARLILESMFLNDKLAESDLTKGAFQKILNNLAPDSTFSQQELALQFLTDLLSKATSAFPLALSFGTSLLTQLLVLSDSDTREISALASSLVARLKSLSVAASDGQVPLSSHSVIVDQLSGIGTPLSIFALIDLAKDSILHHPSKSSLPILPSSEQWVKALDPHISSARSHSLSITSPLQGFIAITKPAGKGLSSQQPYDTEGLSLLFRLTLYVIKVLSETNILTRVSAEELRTLHQHLPLALQLVNEKLTIDSANEIWLMTTSEVSDEAADVLAQGNALIQEWLQDDQLLRVWSDRILSAADVTVREYFEALTFTDIASRHIDIHGPNVFMTTFEGQIAQSFKAPQPGLSASLLAVSHEYLIGSPSGRKLLNELVALCTEVKPPQSDNSAVRPLLLLNILIAGQADAIEHIPNQRIVFLMQSLVQLLVDDSSAPIFHAEALKLLDPVLVSTRDIYGNHWEQVLEFIDSTWQSQSEAATSLPLLNAALRLYGRIKSLSESEDANEDLTDAWKSKEHSLKDGLVKCLESFMPPSHETNQPRSITARQLRRHLASVEIKHDPLLYLLLSSPEEEVQGAAYDLLHRSIPVEQEQISLDLALEHKVAQLPADLVSALTSAPATTDSTNQRQSYLLAWQLVFDHFPNASYKLRELYTDNIKSQNLLPGLLDLVCEICRITSGRPIDASKVDIKNFQLGISESHQKEEQWLAIHVYFCALMYLPSLTRSWFIEQKNRIKSPLESWTQKYFTGILVSSAMSTVMEWVERQAQEDSEAPIVVKPSLNGSEAVASIAVDPESPPISLAVSLPSSYPLESPSVSSRTRVGVSEKNWQSWMRTFQIIIFSTGSIIEGLVAFRRNVQGALKGQSECAICYSIIGTDMQTPNKKCGTCRNTFHSVCLFRWFKSSNSSSCPLCRNNFNYA
ncbi:hypothetical protein PV10_02712 [Exophiala mesophila]|uniref:E3 ubiquitin-protein ligase listerin n=1 Tax=Exophiala mesophila TaxID=212818 RepID=A0A0D1ZM62_EXOME|nr:uncharacterized protein PV10_02712 [Exophiala mesophila]KIV95004.1 hypothetical protein PV10_02712 [Exophiala mesophila]